MDEAHHGEGKKMRELFLGNEAFKSIPVMGFSASTGDMENEYKQIKINIKDNYGHNNWIRIDELKIFGVKI